MLESAGFGPVNDNGPQKYFQKRLKDILIATYIAVANACCHVVIEENQKVINKF